MRVLVAMSGGVDSSVAAARLVDAGYDVVGVTLHLWDYPDDAPEKTRCCAPEDVHDARLVADHLGIPHYSFDRRELFHQQVVTPFVDAYLAGSTPSPCVRCNRTVKMRELLALADQLGAAKVATGHYARISEGDDGAQLMRGRDPRKDQSYYLHMLTAGQLARVLFPIGDALKDEVRAEARARDLPGAEKGESQELCFVPDGDYAGFVAERADGRVRPGPILDSGGAVLAQHDGIHRFTHGQRRGLGVATGKPVFVTDIRPDGAVVVGDARAASCRGARLSSGDWASDVTFPLTAELKVRSHDRGTLATLQAADDGIEVTFAQPVRGVAPGQLAVAYDGDRVLGGATIVRGTP